MEPEKNDTTPIDIAYEFVNDEKKLMDIVCIAKEMKKKTVHPMLEY